MLKYSASHYDERLVLKVPTLLWVAILYGIRHYFIVGAAFLMPMDVITVPWINMQSSAYFLLTDLLAALVLLSIGHRVPDAIRFMRHIWINGRMLLTVSYMAGIFVFVYTNLETMSDPDSWHFVEGLVILFVDLLFVGYLLASGLVKDVFLDFPTSSESPKIQSSAGT